MKKISTLFKKDPNDLGRVINEIDPQNEWALTKGFATRKYDGTACAIIDGKLYKRYDAKLNRKTGMFKEVPVGAIPCQEPDETTGHHPHWVPCDVNDPADKYHFEGFDAGRYEDGTYELIGEKVQGNPEGLGGHLLVPHGFDSVLIDNISFEGIREVLEREDIEGIVFHHEDPNDGRMCKIRKSDFGIKR